MSRSSTLAGQAVWYWRDGVCGLLTGLAFFLAVLMLRPTLLQLWNVILSQWGSAVGLAMPAPDASPPSTVLLVSTALVVVGLYAWAGQWHERLYPLRVLVRALCLVQASACLFFAWAPAHFPHAVEQHLKGLLWMGADLLTIVPLMLTLGWGLLPLPWGLRLWGTLLVVVYFVAWVPHQVLLHAWVLAHGTVLFMPLLMLCLGPVLNGWLFVALYAWLASLTPEHALMPRRPS